MCLGSVVGYTQDTHDATHVYFRDTTVMQYYTQIQDGHAYGLIQFDIVQHALTYY
jgi:hypothetical protein